MKGEKEPAYELPPPYHEVAMPHIQPTIVQVEFEEPPLRKESCLSKYFKCCG